MKTKIPNIKQWDLTECAPGEVRFSCIIPTQKCAKMPPIGSGISVTIEDYRKHRSASANAYFWRLSDLIANAIDSTKEEVYKEALRAVGVYQDLRMPEKSARRFESAWSKNGLGWFVDFIAEYPGGVVEARVYYGSSTYNSAEMSRLIDWAMDEAERLDIDTITPAQKALLLDEWEAGAGA